MKGAARVCSTGLEETGLGYHRIIYFLPAPDSEIWLAISGMW